MEWDTAVHTEMDCTSDATPSITTSSSTSAGEDAAGGASTFHAPPVAVAGTGAPSLKLNPPA